MTKFKEATYIALGSLVMAALAPVFVLSDIVMGTNSFIQTTAKIMATKLHEMETAEKSGTKTTKEKT